MKTQAFFTVLVLLLVFNVNAQSADSVLFRGYPNQLLLSHFGFDSYEFELKELDNISIENNGNGVYVLFPAAARKASVLVLNRSGQIQDTLHFNVYNRPRPSVYFCGVEEGKDIETVCGTIEVKYCESVRLTDHFEVLSYHFEASNLSSSVSGTGNDVQDFEVLKKQLKSGEKLTLTVTYRDMFGQIRKTTGTWVLR